MKNPIRWGVSYFPGGNVFRGSLCFRVYFFPYWYFMASFLKDDKYPSSDRIHVSINEIRLVSMCFLGAVLWLMLVPAGHLRVCSLNRVTVEVNLCATCHIFALPSFAGQNLIVTRILAFSEPKSNSKVLNEKTHAVSQP